MKKIILTAAAASLALAVGPMSFEDFDSNNDGKVTQEEFTKMQAQNMSENAREGMPMRNAANAPSFAQMDQDGDGMMTREEFDSHRMQQMHERGMRGQGKGYGQGRNGGGNGGR